MGGRRFIRKPCYFAGLPRRGDDGLEGAVRFQCLLPSDVVVAAEILKLLEIRPEEKLGILQLVNEINAPGTKTSRELVEAHREEHEGENLNSIGVRG